ncbi:hypothetical protein HHL25_03010 [Rhizobium sp. S-51]|uniref:Uncharacterized protein n=1 Tax=Rhizobium terricola TaxID=2728849 RepID=A0A7Y0AT92_9HYPH|nr:hypothetical protein [Rhizobium terricola]NML73089.1 hypothetical protein [Rhizobium terricola]
MPGETVERSGISLEARYATAKEMYFAVAERQYAYGKWLLASLLTVHAGSLLAISQAGDAAKRLYQACGPLLIYGVAITLIAGGLAWINFSVVARAYATSMVELAKGRDPRPTKLQRLLVGATFWITPLVATVSLVLFIAAAIKATAIL